MNTYRGERIRFRRSNEKGYLSYVGVSCNSRDVLECFIREFRNNATEIKEESDRRDYI